MGGDKEKKDLGVMSYELGVMNLLISLTSYPLPITNSQFPILTTSSNQLSSFEIEIQ